MTKWLILNADGEIDQIENQDPDPSLTDLTGKTVISAVIPPDYPALLRWEPSTQTFVPAVERAKLRRWDDIKEERDARRVVSPFAVEGGPSGTMDCDETGRSNILGMLQAIDYLGAAVAEPIIWKLHDNSFASFTRDQFKSAALQVLEYIQACYATSFALEEAIDAATSIEEVEAIEWPASPT